MLKLEASFGAVAYTNEVKTRGAVGEVSIACALFQSTEEILESLQEKLEFPQDLMLGWLSLLFRADSCVSCVSGKKYRIASGSRYFLAISSLLLL